MSAEVLSTAVHRDFAGEARKFELRIGEIKELEQICGAGVGEIYARVCTLRFRLDDIRQTIRLGLVGGGLEPATAMVFMRELVDGRELNTMHGLAVDVLRALFVGIDEKGNFAGVKLPDSDESPATSPRSTSSAPQPDSVRETSTDGRSPSFTQ